MNTERPTLAYAISRVLIACCLWMLVLFLASAAMMTFTTMQPGMPWLSGLVIQAGILVFSLALIMILGRGNFSRFGFVSPKASFLKPILIWGIALGLATGLAEALFGGGENPATADLTFLQIVLIVWIWASTCEEVLYRGLLQSYLDPLRERGVNLFGVRLSLPVTVGAVLFSVMHLMLLTAGMAPAGVIPILIFALLLGGVAGYFREKTGSLLPAILVHFLGNVAGTLVGYIM
ncbi:CPBP family intramembrane metalloprotease [bacterium]|nr:CPBP family intramembrane metalloprotease [bacterium]MBU1985488.1 CPBP family intramembrane metalloprotease [bacterium]